MLYQFSRHYTRDEARALLPQVRAWFKKIAHERTVLTHCDEQLAPLLAAGADCGGEVVNRSVKAFAQLNSLLAEFAARDIQIKDLDRGLIDFPTILGGKEVFLCWELDEPDIEFWHDLSSGYSGREPLES